MPTASLKATTWRMERTVWLFQEASVSVVRMKKLPKEVLVAKNDTMDMGSISLEAIAEYSTGFAEQTSITLEIHMVKEDLLVCRYSWSEAALSGATVLLKRYVLIFHFAG